MLIGGLFVRKDVLPLYLAELLPQTCQLRYPKTIAAFGELVEAACAAGFNDYEKLE